ncbi:MAG: hypothetical protein JSV41_08595 [Gemmatimonadota bacterium]|nr:MAG: hypothetical protein JSV41_08595 [Gemmatimonadota bacterium]
MLSEVVIIVAVVAVLGVIVAFVLLRRRRPARVGELAAAEPSAPGPAVRAETVTGPAEVAEKATVRAVAGVEAAAEPAAAPAVKPVLSKDELRSRVEHQLAESERMLEELRKSAAGTAGAELVLGTGSLEIMAEGLEEVRALARRKQWSQARDKCGALHAQLSLLLRSTRRERSS